VQDTRSFSVHTSPFFFSTFNDVPRITRIAKNVEKNVPKGVDTTY